MNVGLADLPLQHKLLKPEIDAAIEKVFSTAGFILGENVSTLEAEIAESCGAKYGIGVNSGTDALLLSLAAAGMDRAHASSASIQRQERPRSKKVRPR